ncbi:MAG: hypothetical protein R3D98_17130 [Candidatus Krumholzibacteriia bacterium]
MPFRSAVTALLLAVLVLGACSREPRPPADRDVAMRRLVAHLAVSDDAAALDDLRGYLDRVPRDPVMRYNLACLLARLGEPDGALAALRLALHDGYRRLDQIRQDEDLAALRDDPRLEALLTAHIDSLTALTAAATLEVAGDQWSVPHDLSGGGSLRVRVTPDALEVASDLLADARSGWLVVAVPTDLATFETRRAFVFTLRSADDALVAEPPTIQVAGNRLRVPWSAVVPQQPPLDLLLGLNLVLESRSGRHALIDDPLLGSSDTDWRRYAPLVIDPGAHPAPLLVARPDTRLAIGDTLAVEVAVQGQPDGEVPVSLQVGGREAAEVAVVSESGLGYDTVLLALGTGGPGWVELGAASGSLRWSGTAYRLPSDWFLTHNAALETVPLVEQDIVRYWLFKVLRGHQVFDPRDDPAPLAEAVARTEALLARFTATGSVLPDTAAVMPVAVRTGQDALMEARLALPDAARRDLIASAGLVLVDDAIALADVSADLHRAAPDGLWLVLPAAPGAGLDQATVARVHAAGQWLRELMPSVTEIGLVGVGRAATSAVLAAQAAPSAWADLRLWADWTLDPWPLAATGSLAESVPLGVRALAPRISLPPATGVRAAAVAAALGGTVEPRDPGSTLVGWLMR